MQCTHGCEGLQEKQIRMLRRLSASLARIIKKTANMAEALDLSKHASPELGMEKRPLEKDEKDAPDEQPAQKKVKQEQVAPMQGRADRKRKVAILLAYCGKGYYGIQRNKGFDTIEEELLKALLKNELIPQEHFDCPQKMSFQRAARTDKGVSAVGNVVSLKMLLNQDTLVDNINASLPPQIRVIAYRRATKAFNSKNQCGGRTYAYMTPTYAFAPLKKFITAEYRITEDIITEVNRILAMYKGTHNFHNFTSGIKPDDPSAKRYIISFECGQPFVTDGTEFVVLRVKGQSFMLHHIRKMIGLMIAIVKGYCGEEVMEKAWQPDKVDVPKAPGVGLMLEQLHYDGYNKRFGKDGMHEALDWSEYEDVLENFKKEHILSHIVKSEIEESVMLKWLGTMHFHKFDIKEEEVPRWKMFKIYGDLSKEKGGKKQDGTDDSSDSADLTDSGTTLNKDNTVAAGDATVVTEDKSEMIMSGETKTQDPKSEETTSDAKGEESGVKSGTVTDSNSKNCGEKVDTSPGSVVQS
ncbi:tRNA pseudouridine synthase A-like isoform X2 [Haliotis rufescens]|uniref:tRNA pseudouridine synthase A-like isoform X2 n=1 Tax=Haliotis rufescens TaxID=6454 RepID=UPI00201EEC03|nr:tRNA pseudouridine synthase A-like isoform X2 [Haliotis rufescens]